MPVTNTTWRSGLTIISEFHPLYKVILHNEQNLLPVKVTPITYAPVRDVAIFGVSCERWPAPGVVAAAT